MVRRWVALLALICALVGATTTTAAATFTYDTTATTRVDAQTTERAETPSVQTHGVSEWSSTARIEARGTSTAPDRSVVATKSFDEARVEAFDSAFGKGAWDESADIVPTKWDPGTGTAVEFKGPGGAKVGYDGPHPDTPGAFHDQQHISWQSAGKRGNGGSRGNIPYSGSRHPSRAGRVGDYE
jgi:Bacterial toxin 47